MRVMTRYGSLFLAACAWALVIVACSRSAAPAAGAGGEKDKTKEAAATGTEAAAAAGEPYVPGLGEIMSLQQMRHTKLWLAGKASNWKLASYEIDELGEGFDDVVKYHPTHKDSPIDPKDAVPLMTKVPLEELRQAVDKQDGKAFASAYDDLTTACNS